jgi:hypothetical protein
MPRKTNEPAADTLSRSPAAAGEADEGTTRIYEGHKAGKAK